MQERLRLGCVKYLNARPLIHGWPGDVLLDHPANLCDLLARGDLDVALVSSFEFLRDPSYGIVDGASIASRGPVYSVFVAHLEDIADLGAIELDPASRTSANLLQCILAASGCEKRLIPLASDSLADLPRGTGRMLIGDQAIRFRKRFGERYRFFDLGEQWFQITNLPFVYALWLIRPDVLDAGIVAKALRKTLRQNLMNLEVVARGQQEFEPDFCARYYSRHLRFEFADPEKAGLQEFRRRCAQLALLPENAIVELKLF